MDTLLIIDPQNDFCNESGSLFVPGAGEDITNICNFIEKNGTILGGITVTLDWHQPFSIFHPSYWLQDGKAVQPFTPITLEDVNEGKFIPKVAPGLTKTYLEELESSGEYGHFIWPEHCIAGTAGAAIVDDLAVALNNWTKTAQSYKTILKGESPFTEFFGAFKAQVVLPGQTENDWNIDEINALAQYDTIYVAGEAKSHCVAQTVRQLLEFPNVRKKLVILEDCMSNVPGFETIADPIWEKAKELGVKFAKSTDI